MEPKGDTDEDLTTTDLKVATTLTALAALALAGGAFHLSDETLKEQIEPLGDALDRLHRIG